MEISPIPSISKNNAVSGIQQLSTGSVKTAGKSGATSFSDVINDAITKVNNLQVESSQLTDDFISGKSDNIHSVIIAGSKADLALQMTLQVRNKVMDAYNEIMRMNI